MQKQRLCTFKQSSWGGAARAKPCKVFSLIHDPIPTKCAPLQKDTHHQWHATWGPDFIRLPENVSCLFTYHQWHAAWLYQVWHRTVHKWIFQHGAYQHFRWSACWPAADLGARWPAPHDLAPFDPANLKLRRRGTRKQRQIDFRFLCPGRRRRLIWLDFVVWRELLCLMDCLFELQPLEIDKKSIIK